jgi:Do/DeqQ family serine protease
MKNFLFAILFSIIGGFTAIGGYNLWENKSNVIAIDYNDKIKLANYIFDTTDVIVPEGLNFIYTAKVTTPSVVHIRTTYEGRNSGTKNPFGDMFRDFFGERYDYREREMPKRRGTGSGVIMSKNGYIITNNHVVENASEVEVLLNDNRTFKATIEGTDPTTDLAILKIEANNLPTIKFGNSDNLQIGEWVLAVGSPFEFRSTVTAGIVSAKARNIGILRDRNNLQIEAFIQHQAPVNPGNSGGALVNLEGKLVGINSAIATPTGTFAGYSFAIPSTLVEKVYRDLVEFGVVQRALLGITIQDVTAEIAKENDIPVLFGVLISGVNDGSSAFEAGLEKGDVITEINDVEIKNVSNLQEQIAINRPGDKVEVTYIRDGKTKSIIATLKNTLGTTDVVASNNNFSFDGAQFSDLSKELKEKLDLEGGAQVINIEKGKWKNTGITKGFIVTSINKRAISDVEDLSTTLSQLPKDDGVLVEGMYPNGIKAYYGIGW